MANAYGASASIEWEDFASPLINDNEVYEEVKEVTATLIGEENIVPREPSLGGDDFADLLLEVPGMYAYLGTRNEKNPNTCEAAHTTLFDIDEEALVIGASLYYEYALRVVN